MTTAKTASPKTSTATPGSAPGATPAAATHAVTEQVGTALETGCDLALKGFEAHRQLIDAAFSGFAGQSDPFEVRSRTRTFFDGMLAIAEAGVKDSTTLTHAYVKGFAAATTVENGAPKDFAEIGTRIEKTVGELTGLNRSTAEQAIEMTTRQAKGLESLVRETLPATATA